MNYSSIENNNIISSPYLSSTGLDTAATMMALTNIRWPKNPFHIGEIHLQQIAGVQEHVMSYAPKFIRNYMPDQHREFYNDLPFLVIAARDHNGNMWSTLLEKDYNSSSNTTINNNDDDDKNNDYTFVTSTDSTTLHIAASPVPGDALSDVFKNNIYNRSNSSMFSQPRDVGILGIQFETARRNRVNGRVTSIKESNVLVFEVDQSYGNCPQYIKPRQNWYRVSTGTMNKEKETLSIRTNQLSKEQIKKIETSETMFTATGYRGKDRSDKSSGNDSSHRGGPIGFVQVIEENGEQVICWTEFKGNNHYNSLGNIIMDPRIGVTFPDFRSGGLLQVTGTAFIERNSKDGSFQVKMYVKQVNELPTGSLPIRWKEESSNDQIKLKVAKIVQETDLVKSFYFKPMDPSMSLWKYKAGQYLPIETKLSTGEVVKRNYSLSAGPDLVSNNGYYRISVKHEQNGKVSTYLHKDVKVGDTIIANRPSGDFTITESSTKRKVFISTGIGITPLLSMLYDVVEKNNNDLIWIHGAKDPKQYSMKNEVETLMKYKHYNMYTFYSKSNLTVSGDSSFYKNGRVNVKDVYKIIGDIHNTEFYLCGPPSFMAQLQSDLNDLGIKDIDIHFETF